MNRKKRIIISVVGICVTTLILIGITYGYYLVNIKENINDKSVTINTNRDLALEYCEYYDGNYVCNKSTDAIAIEAEKIVPGEKISEMKFKIKNTGNDTISDYGIYLEDVINTFDRKEDITLNVICESDKTDKCNGYDGNYPENNALLFENALEEGETHTFTLKIEYINQPFDQSVDMGKTLSGKINVYYQPEVVDIRGTVTILNTEDIAQNIKLSSKDSKIGKIVDNKFVITAVGVGYYDIYLNDYPFASFEIKRGEEASFTGTSSSGFVFTIADNTQQVFMEITYDGSKYDIISGNSTTISNINISPLNPYTEGTLAYNILNNSYNNLNGTQYASTPPSSVAEEASLPYWNKSTETSTVINSNADLSSGLYFYTSNSSFISRLDEFMASEDIKTLGVVTGKKFTSEFINKCYTDIEVNIINQKYTATPTNAPGCEEIGIFPKTCNEVKGKYLFDTKNVTYVSDCNEDGTAVLTTLPKAERVLSKTLDDEGVSYYYRGAVEDNYVNFAGMCWRIVRIEGDGNVKLVLEDQSNLCSSSNGNWNIKDGNYGVNTNNTANYILGDMKTAFDNFATNKLSNYSNKLESKQICLGDNTTAYNPADGKVISSTSYYHYKEYRDLKFNKAASLICNTNNKTSSSIVFPLTANEVVFAGGLISNSNYIYYLLNDYQRNKKNSLGLSTNLYWFTSTIGDYYDGNDRIITVSKNGELFLKNAQDSTGLRPAVSLKNVIVTGTGTKNDPYVVQ